VAKPGSIPSDRFRKNELAFGRNAVTKPRSFALYSRRYLGLALKAKTQNDARLAPFIHAACARVERLACGKLAQRVTVGCDVVPQAVEERRFPCAAGRRAASAARQNLSAKGGFCLR